MRSFGKLTAFAAGAAILLFNAANAQEGIVPPAGFGPPGGQVTPVAAPPAGPTATASGPLAPAPVPLLPPALPQPPALPPALPPPLPPQVTITFFVEQNGQPSGPFTLADLEQRIKQGTLKGETLVWKQGTPTWVAAKEVTELQMLIAAIPPPVPQGEQYKRLLVGTWQAQTTDQFGVSTNSTLTYSADGSYSGVVTQSFQSYTIPQVANGTYTVSAVGDGRFTLTMTPGGASGAAFPVTLVFRVLDNNTLSNDADRYQARRIR